MGYELYTHYIGSCYLLIRKDSNRTAYFKNGDMSQRRWTSSQFDDHSLLYIIGVYREVKYIQDVDSYEEAEIIIEKHRQDDKKKV